MGKTVLDANVNNEIFRKDWTSVIAKRRDLASILGARLKLDTNGYNAGQVVARRVSTGLFEKWSAVSGASYDTVSVLFEDVTADDQSATGGDLARVVVGGYVFKDKLVNYDSTAKTQMGAIEQTGADGVTIVKF